MTAMLLGSTSGKPARYRNVANTLGTCRWPGCNRDLNMTGSAVMSPSALSKLAYCWVVCASQPPVVEHDHGRSFPRNGWHDLLTDACLQLLRIAAPVDKWDVDHLGRCVTHQGKQAKQGDENLVHRCPFAFVELARHQRSRSLRAGCRSLTACAMATPCIPGHCPQRC